MNSIERLKTKLKTLQEDNIIHKESLLTIEMLERKIKELFSDLDKEVCRSVETTKTFFRMKDEICRLRSIRGKQL